MLKRKYWLMKTEPDAYSFDDLLAQENHTDHWDGIRNYLARNNMRSMHKGDLVLVYHSSTKPPHAVGVAEVVREAYPDHTAWDNKAKYFDPKSTPNNPRWDMVDIRAVSKLPSPVTLDALKANPKLKNMEVVQKGRRPSVQPVKKSEFELILQMAEVISKSTSA